ncbi:MAG: ATP-dependent DNA helicase RecG [Candidatus Jorgensenbacteria bacterium]
MISLSAPLSEIRGIGPRFLVRLKNLGIKNVKDLLLHFPTRYEDFSQIYKISELGPQQDVTIQGKVAEITGRRSWRRHIFIVEALISDETGSIRAVWFNQPYIRNILRPGRLANFSGKITYGEGSVYLSNPTYELLTGGAEYETKHTGRIVPIYPETRGLTSKGLRFFIKPLLQEIEKIPESIPEKVLKREGLPNVNTALRDIHFPTAIEDALLAKKRFAFHDLFYLQLHNLSEKLKLGREKAEAVTATAEEIKELTSRLPFELTDSQKKSLEEILADLGKTNPMNRLLQGDVGSGKTIIAAISAILTARAGYQTAFMAPTEILASQHYKTFIKFFPEFEKGTALLTSGEARVNYGHGLETILKKPALLKEIGEGKIKTIIGTHALIQKNVGFKNLALVIVDEQHRFGVEQRKTLLKNHKQGNKPVIPNFLSMSATPIPRTLSLTLFGDLDISLINELPKNRKEIITKAVAPENRMKAYAFIRGQVKKGRQVFVICPRIAAPENGGDETKNRLLLEVKNVTEEYEKLAKKIFPDLRVAMLHGKMPAKEKEKTMRSFAERENDILVSTSVVEVGVDIPNATIMMIEGADRFGLAQLYQFRGRVGRGEHQSFCFLFTDSRSKSTEERLKSIIEAKNGFELAEKDLKLRGPGEFLGTTQTGMPDIAMKALQNPELVKSAREAAAEILGKDPSLKSYPLLAGYLEQFKKEIHQE